jgi:AP2 domain/HNH endonuclease
MSTTELTAARLRELLDYDPITGAFTWRSPRQSGYRRIFIDGRLYAASRLAWLWMTGSWPKGQIDHANLKKDDDRWTNLREASQSAQSANRGRLRKNKVGLKGVTYEKRKFRAQITKDDKQYHLGYFGTPQEAHAAYVEAAERLHGEFARGG